MQVRWNNIFGLMLMIFGLYLFLKLRPFFKNIIEDINSVRYYHHNDPLLQIITLGLLCVTVLAAIKILSNRKK